MREASSEDEAIASVLRMAAPRGHGSTTDDLLEWDYGDYEGITTAEIRRTRPDWYLWRDGCPNGEDAAAVGQRADRVIAEVEAIDGELELSSCEGSGTTVRFRLPRAASMISA